MPEDNRPGPIKNASPGDAVATDLARNTALQMRSEGSTYQEIAKALGVCKARAYQLVNDGWQKLIEDNDEIRRTLRAIEIERLEDLIAAIWKVAVGDVADLADEAQATAIENQLKASGIVGKHIQIIARLLGLNAPTKIEHTTKQTSEPLEMLIARVTASKQRRATMLNDSRS